MRPVWIAVIAMLVAGCGPKPPGTGRPGALESFAWSVLAPLGQGRIEHTATRLRDGQVLVVGGEHQDGPAWRPIGPSEVYDPDDGAWIGAASLAEARSGHTATLLASGKVMVVGGQAGDGFEKNPVGSVEVYTPHTDRWSQGASLHEARFGHTVTELLDGRVLVVGGYGPGGLARPEVFDPRTGRWTPAAEPRTPRRGHVAVRLGDGRVLVAGGLGDDGVLDEVEIYDPGANRWIPAPSLSEARDGHAAALVPDGSVLVTGGYQLVGYAEAELASCEAYDPIRNEWREVAALENPRRGHALVVLDGGEVLAIGGAHLQNTVGVPELYTPGAASWRPLPPGPEKLYGSATLLADPGTVMVIGGWNQFQRHSEVALRLRARSR